MRICVEEGLAFGTLETRVTRYSNLLGNRRGMFVRLRVIVVDADPDAPVFAYILAR